MNLDPNELRKLATLLDTTELFDRECAEALSQAADEIERLRSALARYRAAENRLDVHLDGQTLLDEEDVRYSAALDRIRELERIFREGGE